MNLKSLHAPMRRHQPAAKRRQNAAHAARRGLLQQKVNKPRRGGRNVAHVRNILLHFIFSTEGRRPSIKPQFRDDLFAYIGGIVREMNATGLIVNGIADHVHMLIRSRPALSASEIMRIVKTNSSKWVREKYSRSFAWQTGYGVFSVSESSVSEVTKYIAEQEEHHKKRSFQEEFIAFLRKNHVDYDPQHIWD